MLGIFSNIFYILIAVLVLMLMITIHELGHYIAGKKLGFSIKEFSIGFGKKIYSKKSSSGEVFSLRVFPLGGYCAFYGEDDDSPDEQAFNNHKPWKRIIVLVSGALFNLISAVVFAFFVLIITGFHIPQVHNVLNDQEISNPNYSVIKQGDIIRSVEGEDITLSNSFAAMVDSYEVGEVFEIMVERSGENVYLDIEKFEHEGNNILGVELSLYRFGVIEALQSSIPFVTDLMSQIVGFLQQLVLGNVGTDQVAGPITTIGLMANYAQANISAILVLLPFLAVNLAIFNLLPIPALDGARTLFVVIEWIFRKPINRDVEAYIHFIGFLLLLSVIFLLDITHLIG